MQKEERDINFFGMTGYEIFIAKLDSFIRRFYRNRVFKGLFVFLSVLLAVFLLFSTVEYFSYLPIPVRRIFFWFFILLSVAGFFIFVFYPFGQGEGWFRRMSYREAAEYLAARYPELDDKLYNVLDLNEGESTDVSAALLDAAIQQITSRFVSYRFEKTIRFRSVRKYGLLFSGILVFLFLIWAVDPGILRSSERIVRYTRHFEREFPFTIAIANSGLHVPYEEDFTLELDVRGSHLPSEIHLQQGKQQFSCKEISPNRFSYTFRRVQRKIPFRIVSGRYRSGEYVLEVDYKPLISGMKVTLYYPSYMGKSAEVIRNTLDLSVPSGTRIEWELRMDHARDLSVLFAERNKKGSDGFPVSRQVSEVKASGSLFSFSERIFSSCEYFLLPRAYADLPVDTLSFFVETLPDTYPRIEAVETIDSNRFSRRYFSGRIGDDYGFHSLVFRLSCLNSRTGVEWDLSDTLSVVPGNPDQSFTYYFDLEDFRLNPGDELTYGFEVRDNDIFYPYKAAYSSHFFYRKLSEEEVREEVSRASASINNQFSLSLQSVQEFGKEVQDMLESLLSKKQLTWQDRKNVELLIQKQEQLREKYEKTAEEIREKQMLQDELNPISEELKEKQKQLQDLLDRLFDDSTLQKLRELQDLMQQNAPQEKMIDALENVKRQKDFLSQDIERNLNLYRQLEFENRLQQVVSDAEKLFEKSKALTEEMQSAGVAEMDRKKDSMLSSQRRLEAERNRLEEDLDKLGELNRKLEYPTSFFVPDSLLDAVRKSIQNTESHLEQDENREARQSQQNTEQALQALLEELSGQMEQIEEENAAEDASFIRFLLKSVIRVSVQQENLMEELGRTKLNDPRYASLIRRQSALNMEIGLVADSVNAIARRQPQIALSTHREVRDMLNYSKESLDHLLGMNQVYYQRYNVTNSRALTRQQYTMTSLNSLALLLSESLDKMQQKMSMKGNGSSSKKQKGMPQAGSLKPGDKKSDQKMPFPSMKPSSQSAQPSLQQMQQDLNRQLEALKKMLQEKQGQGEPREKSGSNVSKLGMSGNAEGSQVSDEKISEAFARAAARQEMIRRMVQEKLQQEKLFGPENKGMYNQILGDMERTEKDLVNRMLNDQILSRQKNIETRLLEAENAELQREKDDKRESREGRVFSPFENDSIEMVLKKSMQGRDLLHSIYPELRPYYKKKVQDFFFGNDKQ